MIMLIILILIALFTVKDTNLSLPVVNLSGRDNRKLSKSHGKGFERSF